MLCTEGGMSWHVQGPANVEAICRLVELGAKVAAVTEQSMLESPLHIAARCGRQDIVKRLLACNLPILSRTKVTPPANFFALLLQSCKHAPSWTPQASWMTPSLVHGI